jgi:hypothetical protein
MWYAQEDEYVRAPTPAHFDRLVDQLEDGDSVLFESIRLPSSDDPPGEPASLPTLEIGEPLEDQEVDLSDDLMTIPTDDFDGFGLPALRAKLIELETEGAQKLQLIQQKDREILALEQQLASQHGPKSPQAAKRGTAEFYKLQYEAALRDLENLKASLRQDGKVRTVSARSARAIKPKFA